MLVGADTTSLALSGLGLFAVLVAAAIVLFGSRTRIVASQQSQAIEAMEARISTQQGELESLQRSRDADRLLLRERDRRIDVLQTQIKTLQDVVTSKEAIDALTAKIAQLPDAVYARIKS